VQPLQPAPAPGAPARLRSEPAQTRERVLRPPPGLARGRWEAPAWAFWLVAASAVLGGLAWIALAIRTRRNAR